MLLPFPGWTLPGVTGAGGLQALVKGGLDVRGQQVVVAGSGPLLLAAAATVRRAGARVPLVAEQAGAAVLAAGAAGLCRWPAKAAQAVTLWRPGLSAGTCVVEAHGDTQLRAVTLRRGDRRWELPCDRLACGFGLVPNTGLGEALGCRLDAQAGLQVDAYQSTGVDGIHAAGECTGIGGGERARVQGAIAGHAAVGDLDAARSLWPQRARWQRFAQAMGRTFALGDAVRRLAAPDTLLCRCEDVALREVAACDGWVDAKLHTRCGMGACQGRICGAAARQLFGWPLPSPRELVSPARIATLTAVDPGPPGA